MNAIYFQEKNKTQAAINGKSLHNRNKTEHPKMNSTFKIKCFSTAKNEHNKQLIHLLYSKFLRHEAFFNL